ncbi:phosphodiesterase [Aureimonas mangrovi]|uniref:phosphodiesterase n=1 Tax=Aureimonas mangrovi TaxID=2758041 RepID=UPI00163D41D6|nr:phosphodiesterase [Aureimonas mangrovi]
MKIIQITDTHLVPRGLTLYGLDPAARLELVVEDVMARHADADLLAITGDLCNDGEPGAYALLRDILSPLPMPVRLMLGNHDDRLNFRQAFPEQPVDAGGFVQSVLDTAYGRLLFLDTHHPKTLGGRYCAARRGWLESALAEAGDTPVTVFLHHPPLSCGLAHFRNIGLHDAEAVLAPLRAHRGGVRHILFGHIHVALSGTSAEGFAYSSGQSSAHRFAAELDDPTPFWVEDHPCYRIVMLDENGLRAYAREVGQRELVRAGDCEGP